MTLTELRYIVTLAKEKHFGRAADRCNVSQPTLSIAVKKLEDELGIALFERTKTHVKPTPIGERVVTQAQVVIEQTATIRDIASEGKGQLTSPLSLGAIFTIGPYLLPHVVPSLQKTAPQMPLFVEEGYTATLRKRLRNGDLDVVIVALPFSEPDVVTQALYEEPLVVLLPSSHPLAKKEKIKSQELETENVMLLGEGHCLRDQILEVLPFLKGSNENSSSVQTATEGSSLETLRHMVASGLGISILPLSATINTHYSEGVLTTRPISGVNATRSVALAWRVSFPRHKAIDALRHSIQQCALAQENVVAETLDSEIVGAT